MSCVYLSKDTGQVTATGLQVHECHIHSRCVQTGESEFKSCDKCHERLVLTNPEFARLFLDQLLILDRTQAPTHALRGLLAGKPAFLVCGGPSAKQVDLRRLEQRGVWSLAVNNAGGMYRSNAFVCADPPCKFHHGIWLDPGTIKFVPIPKLSGKRGRLRRKVTDTEGSRFENLEVNGKWLSVVDCPNVWGFSRRSWMQIDETFFTDIDAAWGNQDVGVRRTGQPKTAMTMLLAIRILYYLGCRRIYLVGVDFQMNPQAGLYDNYAFGQARDQSAIQSNNNQFTVANSWLCQLEAEVFPKFGLEIYNCYERSGLRAFPYVPFDAAVDDVVAGYPQQPFDLEGWYEKR